ncbi:B-cell linker protein [Rhodnius prolixus]|uniref:B-cell linker protein n=1 Tax=Rhodnius prolixus TaxID=13249 RepID=UPI003D189CAE
MCFYIRIFRALVHNLAVRLWTDFVDWIVVWKRRFIYRCHRLVSRYDDVGPVESTVSYPATDQSDIATGLEDKPWYHAVDRRKAHELVYTGGDGCYLVRPSSTHPLTLTLWFGNRPYNIAIRKREDGKVALGTRKNNERTFTNIEEMIKFYETEELILFSCGERTGKCALRSTPDRIPLAIEKERKQLRHILIHIPQ